MNEGRFCSCSMKQAGFTLVEVMIAMLIGLFLLGGVLTVFSANQHTARVKQNLDNTQEVLRFGAYTISRLVRNAEGFNAASNSNILSVHFSPDIAGVLGCAGEEIAGSQTIVINVDELSNRLVCNGDGLAIGLSGVNFEYGFIDGSGSWVVSLPANNVTTSVKTSMQIQPDDNFSVTTVSFVSTIRHKLL